MEQNILKSEWFGGEYQGYIRKHKGRKYELQISNQEKVDKLMERVNKPKEASDDEVEEDDDPPEETDEEYNSRFVLVEDSEDEE